MIRITSFENCRRRWITSATFCLVIATLLLCARFYVFADEGSISGLEIDVNPIPSGDLPLDKMIKHKFEATNTGNTRLEIDFSVEVISPFSQKIGTVSPEPQKLYLDPGDTQVLMTKMDEKWGKIPVYLPGEINEPGSAGRTYRWTFTEAYTGQTQIVDVEINYFLLDDARHVEEVDRNENVSGPLVVKASVVDQDGQAVEGAQLKLTTGHWESVATSDSTGRVAFRGVPWREDWILEARSLSQDGLCAPLPEPCNDSDPYWETTPVARAMRFINEMEPNYSLQLQNPSWTSEYQLTNTVKSGVGFWRGSVDDAGDNVLLVQGMENWVQANGREKDSKLFLYTADGELRWSYPMGWEAWGANLSRDAKWAAFVTSNPTKNLGVIDAQTGKPLWIKTAQDITETTHPELDSKEIQISSTNQYLGIGGTDGTFLLADLLTGTILWTRFVHGQVRGILFDKSDQFVYVGAGNGKAYKLDALDGSLSWTGEIGSWPYVNGFQLSPDETTLAAGGKYGDLTLLDTSNGETIWYHDMRDIVAWLDFSPDGKYLIAGGGGQYSTILVDVSTGQKIWQIPMYSFHGRFTVNGSLILIDNYLFDLLGNEVGHLVLSEAGCVPGCQGLFAYISDDLTRIIQTRRDIDPSAISLYFAKGNVVASVPTPISDTQNTSTTGSRTEEGNVPIPQVPQGMDVVQCLIKQVGLTRALELANRIPPSPSGSESQALSDCMSKSPRDSGVPAIPPSIETNPFLSDNPAVVNCLTERLGATRYQELLGSPPSIPTSDEIETTGKCMASAFTPEKRHDVPMTPDVRQTPPPDAAQIQPQATRIPGEPTGSGGSCSSPVHGGQRPLGTIILLIGAVSLGGRKLFFR